MVRSSVGAVLELAALDKHDWELALQRILRIDSHVLHVDRASYWDLANEPRSIICELGYVDSADALERGAVLTNDDAGEYLDELGRARVIDVEDVEHDPRTVELRDYCQSRNIRAMLDVPVWVQSRLAGVVCHEHIATVRRWTAAEIDFALSVAQVIATALEARARTRAEEQERQASFLAHTSMVLSQSLDERVVLDRAVETALPHLGDWAAIDRFDGDRVERIAYAHVDPSRRAALADYVARFPPGAHTPHMTVQARRINQAAVVADVTDAVLEHTGFGADQIRALRELGIRSAIAVPFRTPSGIDGVVELISSTRSYDYDTLRLAERY
ncbi:MAG TPA: GAF domain-containing protein, partial [Polyangia bacterium]